ncbi:MAG: right-handed parallel beta-helix repeat-containing protein [Litorilinea sp.]
MTHTFQKLSARARRSGASIALAFFLLLMFAAGNVPTVGAQPLITPQQACQPAIVVENNGNSGPGTLRSAMDDLCADGVITFGSSMTIVLSEELVPPVSMTLNGGNRPVTISGNQAVRVLKVNNGVNLTVTNLTITQGLAPRGGGINVAPEATLDFNRSLLVANLCNDMGQGCGLQNDGVATIRNSTISNNSGFQGAGIQNDGTATIVNVTFSHNSGTTGASLVNYGTLSVRNSIFANSSADEECFNAGTFAVNSNNLIEDDSCSDGAVELLTGDPDLSSLGDYGGSTFTHAIVAASIVHNAGDATVCAGPLVENRDQRGETRPGAGTPRCDIGGYELQVNELTETIYLPALSR